jgi:protein TonB
MRKVAQGFWIVFATLLADTGPVFAQIPIPPGSPPPSPFAQQAPGVSNGCGRTAGIFLRAVPNTHLIAPYPSEAVQNHESGRVLLRVVVDREGNASEATVTKSSGYPDLDDAAIASVKGNWRWQPPPPECAEMGVVVPVFYIWNNPVSAP